MDGSRLSAINRFITRRYTALISQSRLQVSRWAGVLLVIVLCLGLFFRVTFLEQKVFWLDEAATGLRVAGYVQREMQAEIVDGPEVSAAQLKKYQYPNADRSVFDTVRALAVEDVQHPPLFFVLLHFWVNLFGPSLSAARSLSAVFSVLVLPVVWLLCRELFASQAVGWVAIALLAVSPVQVVYAQESRQYSLLMLMMGVSSLALLRSLRLGTVRSWALYGVSVAVGLYTHFFFGLIAIAQGLYTLGVERWQNLRRYGVAAGLALLSFSPWIFCLLSREQQLQGFEMTNEPTTLPKLGVRLLGVVSRTFVDFGVSPSDSAAALMGSAPWIGLVLGASVAALGMMIRRTSFRVWFFGVTLAGVTGAVILLGYLVFGKQVAYTRYILPIALSLDLAVAFALAQMWQMRQKMTRQILLWRGLGAILLSAGVVSCVLRSQTAVWWTQLPQFHRDTPAIARVLERTPNALVLVDNSNAGLDLWVLQGLANLAPESTRFQLIEHRDPRPLMRRERQTFVYVPVLRTPEPVEARLVRKFGFKRGIKLERVLDGFWRVLP